MDEQWEIPEAESWDKFLNYVEEAKRYLQESQAQETPLEEKKFWYRGHEKDYYTLTPSLFRYRQSEEKEEKLFQLYRQLILQESNQRNNDWEMLFEMQHYGVPTRLLDWTEVLGIAVYFAITPKSEKPCIYILDPVKLNNKSNLNSIINASDLSNSLDDQNRYQSPIAISPAFHNIRLRQQRGKFTLHGLNREPLENQCHDCVCKVILLPEALDKASNFLEIANLNAFSLFPDFVGKAIFIKNEAGLEPIPYDKTIANKIRTRLEQRIDKDRKILQELPIGDPGRAELFIKGISACNIDDSFIRRKNSEQKLATWLKQDKKPYMFIYGEAGIGKTNFLLRMALFKEEFRYFLLNTIPIIWLLLSTYNSIAGILFLRKSFKTKPVVFFSFKSYELEEPRKNGMESKESRLEDFLFQYIFPEDATDQEKLVTRKMLTNGKIILILDGLDELARIKGQDFIQKVSRELDDFINRSKRAKVVISCRNYLLKILKESRVLGSKETIETHEIKKLEKAEIENKFLKLLRDKPEEIRNNTETIKKLVTLAQVPLFYQLICQILGMQDILDNPQRLTEVVDNRAELYKLWFEIILKEHGLTDSISTSKMAKISQLAEEKMREIGQLAKEMLEKRRDFVKLKDGDLRYPIVRKLCKPPFNVFVEEYKDRFTFSHQSLREFILAWSASQEIIKGNFSVLSGTPSLDYEGAETYRYFGELIDLKLHLVDNMKSILGESKLDPPGWNNLVRNLFEAVGMLAPSEENLASSEASLMRKVIPYAIELLKQPKYNNIYVRYRTKYNIVRCLERLHPSAPKPYFKHIIKNPYPWTEEVSRNNIPAFAIRGYHREERKPGEFPHMIFENNNGYMEIPDLENEVSNCLLTIIENLTDDELLQDAEFLKINCTFALIRWLPQDLNQEYNKRKYNDRIKEILNQVDLCQFMTKNICESITTNIYWVLKRRYENIPQEFQDYFPD